jgi:hypothetical protein
MALIKGFENSAQVRNSIMSSLSKAPIAPPPTNGKKKEQRHQGSSPKDVYENFPSPKDWRH